MVFGKVLVTGGAGFIGSHIVDDLLKNGTETWVLDNLSTGSKRNLNSHLQDHRLHFVRGSVTNRKILDKLTHRVEAIIHLAAIVSPFISVTQPELTNEVNISGTLNMLRSASYHGIQRIVFASSSSVYGDATVKGRVGEEAQTNPITPYGASKLAGEKYCRAFYSTYQLSTVSLRFFNVYGERQKNNPYSGVIAIFANNLLHNRRSAIFGDGRQTRDFIHVSDVAKANLLALRFRGKGDAFNVGTGVRTSINQLYSAIANMTGKTKLEPIKKPARIGDIKDSCANMQKANMTLGFEARLSLRTGLPRVLDYLQRIEAH